MTISLTGIQLIKSVSKFTQDTFKKSVIFKHFLKTF